MTTDTKPARHPSDKRLKAFLEDKLDDQSEEKVRDHINICDRCRDRFLDLIQAGKGKE